MGVWVVGGRWESTALSVQSPAAGFRMSPGEVCNKEFKLAQREVNPLPSVPANNFQTYECSAS